MFAVSVHEDFLACLDDCGPPSRGLDNGHCKPAQDCANDVHGPGAEACIRRRRKEIAGERCEGESCSGGRHPLSAHFVFIDTSCGSWTRRGRARETRETHWPFVGAEKPLTLTSYCGSPGFNCQTMDEAPRFVMASSLPFFMQKTKRLDVTARCLEHNVFGVRLCSCWPCEATEGAGKTHLFFSWRNVIECMSAKFTRSAPSGAVVPVGYETLPRVCANLLNLP